MLMTQPIQKLLSKSRLLPLKLVLVIHMLLLLTIEDGPRGKERELDNNPQASVLQQPEYFAIVK